MNNTRIVFMGTPGFAAYQLEQLIKEGANIVGVITVADKPAGRGRKINQSAVKEMALKYELPILQPKSLKSKKFLEQLKELKADLQIIVAFRMLPKAVWDMPKMGTFNLHASLLPQYRGAAPINWAIINGETQTGNTTFLLDDKIDTGNVLMQSEISIDEKENAGTLHDKLMQDGPSLILKTIQALEDGTVNPIVQKEEANLKDAPKIFTEDCKINLAVSGKSIERMIRGLSPYPVAFLNLETEESSRKVKLYAADFQEETHELEFGSFLKTKKELKIACKNGFIKILDLQLQGKRRMKISDFLNGMKLEDTSKFS